MGKDLPSLTKKKKKRNPISHGNTVEASLGFQKPEFRRGIRRAVETWNSHHRILKVGLSLEIIANVYRLVLVGFLSVIPQNIPMS